MNPKHQPLPNIAYLKLQPGSFGLYEGSEKDCKYLKSNSCREAAPEMLEALEAWRTAAKYSQQYAHLEDAKTDIADAWHHAEELRDAAIEKAKGETNV